MPEARSFASSIIPTRTALLGIEGMTIWDLDTPALLVDLDRMEANLDRAAEYARENRLGLRPHTKTHKSTHVARMQLERGACGLTVAKVGEAEIMAGTGTPNLLVAYPVWGDAKWQRLVELAKQVPVTVALDNMATASGLAQHASRAGVGIGALAEVDLGMRRCGYPPGDEFRTFVRELSKVPALRFEGLMFYPGHVDPVAPDGDEQLDRLNSKLQDVLAGMEADGIPAQVVSGGSTPTLYDSEFIRGMTEIRPCTYVFNDRTQVAMGAGTWDDCAATILTTVVSTPRPHAAVIDGGSKTFTSDPVRPIGRGFGRVQGQPEIEFERMSEEHGVLDLWEHTGPAVRVGDRLRIVPNHVCVAVNMHERVFGIRGERVETSWAVEARGKLQ